MDYTSNLLFGFFLTTISYVIGQSCDSGSCVPLQSCPELVKVIKAAKTPQEIQRLKSLQCGFDGQMPKVCCPTECYTPEGKPGKCINVFQCPHVAELLQKPPSRDDNVNYVQNLKCQGKDMYSVCCGPPRNVRNKDDARCRGALSAFPPDPKSKCCGEESLWSNRITGGNATSLGQYPWLVLIEYKRNDEPITTMCGGALISGRYVLTAAHCLTGSILDYGNPISVRFSEYDTNNPGPDCTFVGGGKDCNDGTVTIGIEDSIPHADYNTRSRHNDIGLIRLKQVAPFNDYIRPICLPTVDTLTDPSAEYLLTVSGWGAVSESQPYSNIKLFVDVPYTGPISVCQSSYQVKGRRANLWERQICAGGVPGKDSCRGDSGGPLMLVRNQSRTHEAVGIVSFGPVPCGLPGVPGVYTKVLDYVDWITRTIRA